MRAQVFETGEGVYHDEEREDYSTYFLQEEVIKREINILIHLQGGPNIVKLYDVVQHPETKVILYVSFLLGLLLMDCRHPLLSSNMLIL